MPGECDCDCAEGVYAQQDFVQQAMDLVCMLSHSCTHVPCTLQHVRNLLHLPYSGVLMPRIAQSGAQVSLGHGSMHDHPDTDQAGHSFDHTSANILIQPWLSKVASVCVCRYPGATARFATQTPPVAHMVFDDSVLLLMPFPGLLCLWRTSWAVPFLEAPPAPSCAK
jgi:hypothetical protein